MNKKTRLKIKNSFDGNLMYGAGTFNKKTGRDLHAINRKNTITENFFNNNTGRLFDGITKERECPLCDGNDKKKIFQKDGFDHYKCKNCFFIYVNPILKDEKLHNLYLDETSYNNVLTNKLQIDLDKKRFNYCLSLIEKKCESIGRILDIGAGPGIFLETAKDRGWEPTAIEFNSFCIERIEKLGIRCIKQPVEESKLPHNSFECITLWAVLEHLQNPKDTLKHIHNLLKPNGVLLLLVPNVKSLAARILHEKCITFAGDSHINFFDNETLKKIQELCGFQIFDMETIFSEVNTIKNYLNYDDPYLGTCKFDELDFLNPQYIHENLLGYCLVSYAVKV